MGLPARDETTERRAEGPEKSERAAAILCFVLARVNKKSKYW